MASNNKSNNIIVSQIKYTLVILLSTAIQVGGPLVLLFGLGYYAFEQETWLMNLGFVCTSLAVILWYPLRSLRIKYREEVEYDENGISKRKGKYEYMSRRERDLLDMVKASKMENILNTAALKKMIKKGPEHPMEELDNLVGLEPVKETVREMVARMEFEQQENKKKKKKDRETLSGRHMCFFGPPGTGKTTVARIMTSFLYQYGYIKENKCIEVDGNFLKAGADSALKTEMLLKHAYGGVLFIDEAYSLMDYGDGGDQVIATLIKQIEDARDKFVLIIAGYPREMKKLIDQNPGFESRIKDYLNFPDYNAVEMREIAAHMAQEHNFVIDSAAFDMYDAVVSRERKLKSFGNGRTARNILDKAIDKHSLNLAQHKLGPEDRYRLKSIDFQNLKIGTIDAF